jgi:hypothetical protein
VWKRRKPKDLPKTERELCDLLRPVLAELGWPTYPEVEAWDLIAVGPEGRQIGIQAKLRCSVEVLYQATRSRRGPSYRFVLVAHASEEFRHVAQIAGVSVIDVRDLRVSRSADFVRALVHGAREWERRDVWLPPFIAVDQPAGVPSPKTITRWKVAAAQLCADLRAGTTVTTSEIRQRGAGSLSTWREYFEAIPGKPTRWAYKGGRLPDHDFPEVSRYLKLPEPA